MGAGIALVGSYVVMLTLMYVVTRRLFPVPVRVGGAWRGSSCSPAASIAFGELAAADLRSRPASSRGLRSCRCTSLLLWASGFFHAGRAALRARRWTVRLRTRLATSAEAPQDLEALQSRTELMEDVHDA